MAKRNRKPTDHETESQPPAPDSLPNLSDKECESMTLTIPGIGYWANSDDVEAIQALCRWADQYAVILYLTAVPAKSVVFIEGLRFADKNGRWAREPDLS